MLALLGVVCFTLAATLEPRVLGWSERSQADSMLKMFLGEGRRLFANHFFVQADVTFHSGYYPSIFDQARRNMKQSPMVSGEEHVHTAECNHDDGHDHDHDAAPAHVHTAECDHSHEDQGHDAHDDHETEHEREMAFLTEPRDWIERFGRKFTITDHTHLAAGQEREILPWLRISAELDPQRVETYTVAAYWLRNRLGKVDEAEQFLREGLRANPNSAEILFELGNLYKSSRNDNDRARNVWELALRRWREKNTDLANVTPEQLFLLEQISANLGRLEEEAGNYDKAITHFELVKRLSPSPEAIQKQIDEIREKVSGQSP